MLFKKGFVMNPFFRPFTPIPLLTIKFYQKWWFQGVWARQCEILRFCNHKLSHDGCFEVEDPKMWSERTYGSSLNDNLFCWNNKGWHSIGAMHSITFLIQVHLRLPGIRWMEKHFPLSHREYLNLRHGVSAGLKPSEFLIQLTIVFFFRHPFDSMIFVLD